MNMWTRSELKERGKAALHRNYWIVVLATLVVTALTGGTGNAAGNGSLQEGSNMQTEMKPWIILITHGKLGAEVKGSAEMIAGELKNVYSLSLMEGTDPMDLAMELKELLDKAPDDTIILTDLFGGTPSNTAARFALEKNYTVLAGLNLAMLIEAEMQRGMLKGDELEEDLMNAAKDGVRNIRKIMKERKGL